MGVSTNGMENVPPSTVATTGKPRVWTTTDFVYMAAESVVGLLTVVSNALVLAALLRYRYLRTVTNCYIGSLAVADVLVGLLVPPLVVVAHAGLPRNFYACVLVNSLVNCFTVISIISLVCVAFDRYLAVRLPVFHLNVATKRLAYKMTALVWALGFVLGLLPLFGWHTDPEGFDTCSYMRVIPVQFNVYLQFFGVLVPILISVFLVYCSVYCAYSTNIRKHRTEPVTGNEPSVMRANQFRVLTTLTAIFSLFALCWVPLYVINCIRLWSPETRVNSKLILFTTVLTHLNSFINPILYAVNQPGFRQVLGLYLPTMFTADQSSFLCSYKAGFRMRVGVDVVAASKFIQIAKARKPIPTSLDLVRKNHLVQEHSGT